MHIMNALHPPTLEAKQPQVEAQMPFHPLLFSWLLSQGGEGPQILQCFYRGCMI